jgi:hypothetical protein
LSPTAIPRLAINGFDPLAYFIDGAPLQGTDDFEHPYAGAVWRFRNEGNRAAFIADPEVYMPRYGGYDPVGIARGVAVPDRGYGCWWRAALPLTQPGGTPSSPAWTSLIAPRTAKWPQVQLTLTPCASQPLPMGAPGDEGRNAEILNYPPWSLLHQAICAPPGRKHHMVALVLAGRREAGIGSRPR